MSEIIHHDFGKEDREHARKLASLLDLVRERDEDLLKNPGKYFSMAGEKIVEQQRVLESLKDAVRKPWQLQPKMHEEPPRLEIRTINIDKRDYEALVAIKRILAAIP